MHRPIFCATLVALLGLAAVVDAEFKELSNPTETVYFTKSTEVAIMGCFEKESGPEFTVFSQVIAEIESYGGLALGKTTTKAVWSRYLSAEDGAEAPPAVVVWTSFDPETGKIRKGKKTKLVYAGPFEYAALYKFLVRESQPVVLRLPEREGPDFQKRQQLAQQSGFAKLFVFHPKDKDASEALMTAALALKPNVITYHYLVNNDEEDEGFHVMGQFGIKYNDLGEHGAAMMYQGQGLEVYKGDMTDAAALQKFGEEFVETQGEFVPAPSEGGAKGKSKGKKKKSKKSEM